MMRRLLGLLLLCSVSASAAPWWEMQEDAVAHGPFRQDEFPGMLGLQSLEAVHESPCDDGTEMRWAEPAPEGASGALRLILRGGKRGSDGPELLHVIVPGKKKPVLELEMPGYTLSYGAYEADMNGDGKPDLIFAAGLGKEKNKALRDDSDYGGENPIVILLSGPKKPKAWVIQGASTETLWFSTVASKSVFIWSRHVRSVTLEPFLKKKELGFDLWVHHLIEIQGQGLRIADDLDQRFPKIVSASGYEEDRQNHKETKLLNSEEKTAVLARWSPLIEEVKGKHP